MTPLDPPPQSAEDTPGLPDVCAENAGGQRFPLAGEIATAIALPPSDLERLSQ